jgi:hypothetical protein
MHFECSILKIVRTTFSATGGEEVPPRNSERRRSRTADNFKFFFGGVRITGILTNFSFGGKFFYENLLSQFIKKKEGTAFANALSYDVVGRGTTAAEGTPLFRDPSAKS